MPAVRPSLHVLMVQHGWDFFWTSYLQNERSENAVGLDHRWLIKGVFYIGLWLLLARRRERHAARDRVSVRPAAASEVKLQIGHAELEA